MRFIHTHHQVQKMFHELSVIADLSSIFSRKKLKPNNSENVLFIVGSGRSGNTLLRKLLIESYSIYIPPETYVIPKAIIEQLKHPNRQWRETVRHFFSSLEYHPEFSTFEVGSFSDLVDEVLFWPPEKQSLSALILRFYKWHGEKKKLEFDWVGDKTPLNTFHLGLIDGLFPNAKYINITRDGADVVDSYLKAKIYTSYDRAAERWISSLKAWKNFKHNIASENYFEIKYEDLVSKPSHMLKKVTQHLNIPERKSQICSQNLLGDVSARKHHVNVKQEPRIDYIGKGRMNIPAEVKSQLGKDMNRLLIENGYKPLE